VFIFSLGHSIFSFARKGVTQAPSQRVVKPELMLGPAHVPPVPEQLPPPACGREAWEQACGDKGGDSSGLVSLWLTLSPLCVFREE
jgi:hypothetical protein